jgi:hypothetical protein
MDATAEMILNDLAALADSRVHQTAIAESAEGEQMVILAQTAGGY